MKKDVDLKQKKFLFCSMLFAFFDKKFRQKNNRTHSLQRVRSRKKRTCISIGNGAFVFFRGLLLSTGVEDFLFHAAELAVTFVTTSSQRNTGDCFHTNV